MIIFQILLGLAVMAAGFYLVLKAEVIMENFGRLAFFENHLATSGGSRLGYKLVGIVLIIIGFMIATTLIGGFLAWLVSPLTRYSQPIQ
jgi:hypothetical protein